MVSEELKRRLSSLRRGEAGPRGEVKAKTARLRRPSADLLEHFPEGSVCETEHGQVFRWEGALGQLYFEAGQLTDRYLAAFHKAARLADKQALPAYLEPLVGAEAEGAALIDTETAGLHGRPLFMVGLAQYEQGGLVLRQYFARSYAEEAALLQEFASLLPRVKLLISFNGKAFDWPFVRDRMIYHRLACRASFAHLDLLHPSRRRWRAELPDCKLKTLEQYLCGRWRSGDIPGEEIPQQYHDFVRAQDARLIAPVFHHNRMDLITMIELVVALVGDGERRD